MQNPTDDSTGTQFELQTDEDEPKEISNYKHMKMNPRKSRLREIERTPIIAIPEIVVSSIQTHNLTLKHLPRLIQ
jgi:hypothetical protein